MISHFLPFCLSCFSSLYLLRFLVCPAVVAVAEDGDKEYVEGKDEDDGKGDMEGHDDEVEQVAGVAAVAVELHDVALDPDDAAAREAAHPAVVQVGGLDALVDSAVFERVALYFARASACK